jgi:hypothetical protein
MPFNHNISTTTERVWQLKMLGVLGAYLTAAGLAGSPSGKSLFNATNETLKQMIEDVKKGENAVGS